MTTSTPRIPLSHVAGSCYSWLRMLTIIFMPSNSMPLQPAWQGDLNSTPLGAQIGLNTPWGQLQSMVHCETGELERKGSVREHSSAQQQIEICWDRYPGGKIPSTFWVEQPSSSSGKDENKQTKTAPVHNLLAPLTERFNLRITTPPRMVPSTASGMQTPPGGAGGQRLSLTPPSGTELKP